jgi:hypothetical protein
MGTILKGLTIPIRNISLTTYNNYHYRPLSAPSVQGDIGLSLQSPEEPRPLSAPSVQGDIGLSL